MHIIAINGSPRKKFNTAVLLKHATDGALSAGATTETIHLYDLRYCGCISCFPGSTNPDHIQENIEIFDFELSDEEMEQIRAMDQGEDGRYFNLNYEQMGGLFTNPIQ